MAEHTPGPWRVGKENEHCPEEHCESWIPILGADGKVICHVGHTWYRHGVEQNGADTEHREENAFLIAAVLDLLAACKAARDLLRRLGGTNHDPEYSELLAAIAKAEGS